MIDICRLCLNEITQESVDELTSQIDKIKFLMPEIDINIISIFTICTVCVELLNSAYDFKYACIQIDEFIRAYAERTKTTQIDLQEIRRQRLCDTKQICPKEIKIEVNHEDIERVIVADMIPETKVEDIENVRVADVTHQTKNEYAHSFICNICNKNFDCYDEFQKHTEECKIYSCNQCEQIFYNVEQLEKHNEVHNAPKFSCNMCNRTFSRRYALTRHTAIIHLGNSPPAVKCDVCGKILSDKHSLKRHVLTHTNREKKHKCDICSNSYYRLSELINHKKKHTETTLNKEHFQNEADNCKIFPCSQCERILHSAEQLEKHKDNHNIRKSFLCNICNRDFNRKYALNRHVATVHLGKSEPPVKCNICDKMLSDKHSLRRHALTHTDREKKHVCDICNNSYYRLSELIIHKEVHSGKKFNCKVCSKSFSGSWSLKSHMNNSHLRTHVCDTCGMKCGSKTTLVEHIRTHTGERPYRCEICGKGFAQQGSLKVHIRCTHNSERPYVCDTCGKAFALTTLLRLHKETHLSSSERNFVCTVCNKRYTTKKNLRQHARRHLVRNHKCTLCTKTFFLPNALRRHMFTHTGEKPFECEICQKRFNQKSNLQIHYKSHKSKNKISKH